jgi:hypothetical protein
VLFVVLKAGFASFHTHDSAIVLSLIALLCYKPSLATSSVMDYLVPLAFFLPILEGQFHIDNISLVARKEGHLCCDLSYQVVSYLNINASS